MPDLLEPASISETNETAHTEPKRVSRFWTDYYASAFLFLIAVFVVVAFILLRPMILRIKETNAKTTQALQIIERERAYLASLSQSVAAAKTIPPDALEAVGRALPADANLPLLLVQFGTVAEQNNIKIGSISFAEGPPQGSSRQATATTTSVVIPLEVNVTLNARNYFDVKRFLVELESSLRLMDVVGISTSQAGSGRTESSYQLQLRTYIFGVPKTPKP